MSHVVDLAQLYRAAVRLLDAHPVLLAPVRAYIAGMLEQLQQWQAHADQLTAVCEEQRRHLEGHEQGMREIAVQFQLGEEIRQADLQRIVKLHKALALRDQEIARLKAALKGPASGYREVDTFDEDENDPDIPGDDPPMAGW